MPPRDAAVRPAQVGRRSVKPSAPVKLLAMRRIVSVLALGFLLGACAGPEPYTQKDLVQIRATYRVLVPTYRSFKAAYLSNNFPRMKAGFRREQQTCRTVDEIDKRDTISPSVNLFLASEGLDNLCNSIEYAYASWRRDHHMSWDESLNLGPEADLFVNADDSLVHMPEEMRHPGAQV